MPVIKSMTPAGPIDRLVADYRRYLAGERGLAAHTIYNHELVARLFLGERERLDGQWRWSGSPRGM